MGHVENVNTRRLGKKRTLLAPDAPRLFFDTTSQFPRQLPLVFPRVQFADVWQLMHKATTLEALDASHWFTDGDMNSKKRFSYRSDEVYHSSNDVIIGNKSFVGFVPCQHIPFLWEKAYLLYGLQRFGCVIDTPQVLAFVLEQINENTQLPQTSSQLILDFALPQSLFVPLANSQKRRDNHNKKFFINSLMCRHANNEQVALKQLQSFVQANAQKLFEHDWIQGKSCENAQKVLWQIWNEYIQENAPFVLRTPGNRSLLTCKSESLGAWIEQYAPAWGASWWP